MEQWEENRFDDAARVVCDRMESMLRLLPRDMKEQAQEIRLRVNRPVAVSCAGGVYFIGKNGRPLYRPGPDCLLALPADIADTFRKACSYSIYSHQDEIRNGYVTLAGGHRVGVSGTAVLKDGRVTGLREISSVNIRIARQVMGAATPLLQELQNSLERGLLVAGAPASGKTTLLRDIARQLSGGLCGSIRRVAVVDERGELAGTCQGAPQNDLGFCCDVLNGYPKGQGILQAVRALSPEFVVCDELGGEEDAAAVEQGLNAGVALISSIHAGSVRGLLQRRQAQRLLRTGAFGTVALLGDCRRPGVVTGIYKAGDLLAEMDRSADAHSGGNAGGLCGVA